MKKRKLAHLVSSVIAILLIFFFTSILAEELSIGNKQNENYS